MSIYCPDCHEDLAAGHNLDCPQVAPEPSLMQTINNLTEHLREVVEVIEGSTPTTRGHYARYMAIFSQFADDRGQANVLAAALIGAGANKQGVNDALRVSF